jgi:Ca2+-binding RTX toxin-like protein
VAGDSITGGTGVELINGGAGRDVLSYANSVLGVNVNLSTGQTTGGDAGGDTITGIEDLLGSVGDDILAGTSAANSIQGGRGDDRLFSFAGNDFLEGANGADTMTGGDGGDTFLFRFEEDSPTGLFSRDFIQVFSHVQGDRLDMHLVDPNGDATGFGTFEFLGKDALIDAPEQISYTFEGNNTVVEINTAGGFESPPEMEIELRGHVDLVASDFIL